MKERTELLRGNILEQSSLQLRELLPQVLEVTTRICQEVKTSGALQESTKGFGDNGEIDICTEADRSIDVLLCAALQRLFPNHDLISEESEHIRRDNPDGVVFIDALDETSNYAGKDGKGEMDYGTLIAAYDSKGNPQLAIMFMIARGDVYLYDAKIGAARATYVDGDVVEVKKLVRNSNIPTQEVLVRDDRLDLAKKYIPQDMHAFVSETDDVNLRSLQKLFDGKIDGLAYTWKGARQGGDWDMAAPIAIARALGIEVVAAQEGELKPVKLNPDDTAAISAGSVLFLAPEHPLATQAT